ncbi:MAG: tetratricopeptide repeat protein, partial [Pedobacter sp.]
MKLFLATIAILFSFVSATGQSAPVLDSLQKEYLKPKPFKERGNLLIQLASATMSVNPDQADKYGEELIALASNQPDKEALIKSYNANGVRCAGWAGIRNYAEKAMNYFEAGKALAVKHNLKKYETNILLQQANLQLSVPDLHKASKYLEEATTLNANKNDSISAELAFTRGDIQLARNEKINALRSYLTALRLGDSLKMAPLQRNGLLKMSGFYGSIEDYDKAIAYYEKAMDKLKELPAAYRGLYLKVTDLKTIGDLYAFQKNYNLAKTYYENSIKLADSLQYQPLKIHGYIGLLNVFIFMKEPQKSMAFMRSKQGQDLTAYLSTLKMDAIADQANAIIYSEMGQLDSAGKYFRKSADFFNNSGNPIYKMSNLVQTAYYLKRKGDYRQAINLFLQADTLAKSNGQLDKLIEINKNLDTLYTNLGDYRQAKFHSSAYYQYKDSFQTLNKEKQLSQIEADDALQQLQREQLLQEEKKNERNN